MRARHRFVDDSPVAAARGKPATAVIQDETRHVLRGHPTGIALRPEMAGLTEGRASVSAGLFGPLAEARRLVLEATWSLGKGWEPLPFQVVPVGREGGRAFFTAEVSVPSEEGWTYLRIRGYVPPETDATLHEAAPVAVPHDARLEFAIGVLEPAWSQGAVEFSVQACVSGECEPIFTEAVDPGVTAQQRWLDRRVSLEPLAGELVSFRFETRHARAERLEAFTLPVWGNPTLFAAEARGDEEFNVVLISLDTLRADHLPAYGYPRNTAPFIDAEFARRGVLFEQTVSAATTTHGVGGDMHRRPLPEGIPVLARILRGAGFETGAVTEDGAISIDDGFGRGFNEYTENKELKHDGPEGPVVRTFAQVRAWLERHRDKRFFLFLHTYQVHSPYSAPRKYAGLFAEKPPLVERAAGIPPHWSPDRYDREIRYLDDSLRGLFEVFAPGALDERTLFVLTSDHGEGFMEHGMLAHGGNIHDEVLRVPLIFRGPGVPEGRRVQAPVGLVDLMPTLLEFVGLPIPERATGRSFASLVRGAPADASWSARPLFSEAWGKAWVPAGRRNVAVETPAFSVRVGTRKLIRYRDGRYAYYDLTLDPGEMVDRYEQSANQVGDLRALLDEYDEVARSLHREPTEGARAAPGFEAHLDAEREAKLRALGYIE
jgi:arylsulfatase A-like enzyme